MSLSNEQKAQAVAFQTAGWKSGKIAKELGVHRTTIARLLTKFNKTGSYERKRGSGRPKKLSKRNIRYLKKLVYEDRRGNLSDFMKGMAIKVHVNTLRTYLHSVGLHCRVARKKPFLTPRHIAKRLEFAKKHVGWTKEQWRKVLWTDEASFERGKAARSHHAWRTVAEKHSLACLVPTFRSNRISVMIWGGITHGKKTELGVFKRTEQNGRKARITAQAYVDQIYKGPLDRFWNDGDDMLLMEDGAPIHRSLAPKKWLADKNIKKLEWPAMSPDLNPIENLWYTMKVKVHKASSPYMRIELFTKSIVKCWNEIPQEKIDRLIDSMPERIKAVIKAKGMSTRW
jgi:transposase